MSLNLKEEAELVPIDKASQWATNYLGRPITQSNISYLLQYAKIKKHYNFQNKININIAELKNYYDNNLTFNSQFWKNKLGNDLDWGLSFSHLKESDTTKHVHRLHPYKGKFIPQLVEYFLDTHINDYKKKIYFHPGDTILDPFMGSGTTLVQSAELGLNSIGIDVSDFNCIISNSKLVDYDLVVLEKNLKQNLIDVTKFSKSVFDDDFDIQLKDRINKFNKKHFPIPEYKRKVIKGQIDEDKYSRDKLYEFLKENEDFFIKNGTNAKDKLFKEKDMNSFLSKWFSKRVKQELYFYEKLISKEKDEDVANLMRIILSRTARSCRATTHSDLATLKEPQVGPYYCTKHKKICVPTNTTIMHLKRYTYDSIVRTKAFSKLKKEYKFAIIHGDSRNTDILYEIKTKNAPFYTILKNKKIDGVFTSPPYVGQIDYHEQHAYAYELFNIKRFDDLEIGPLFKGQGNKAKEEYISGITSVFKNIMPFVKDDGDYFVVANDKYNLYPIIAENCGLKIVEKFKRPVLNRTERDRQPYCETIFHMKK